MQLKEMSGNADLFNAMKKLEKRQKILEKKEAEKEKNRQKKESQGVFEFLNHKLASGEGKWNILSHYLDIAIRLLLIVTRFLLFP